MNRNYAIAIVLIVVVAGGILLITHWSGSQPASTTESTSSANKPSGNNTVGSEQNDALGTDASVTNAVGVQNPYPPQGVTVNYTTASGFSPSSITIHRGDTVTFFNQSAGDMWIMSDPTVHASYPGFDENKSVSNGGTYTITFTTTGTFDYYNQNDQRRKGTIIVEPLP